MRSTGAARTACAGSSVGMSSAVGITTSRSTGMPSAGALLLLSVSLFILGLGVQRVGLESIPPIAVKTEPFAATAPVLLALVDGLHHPLEAAEEARHAVGEIDEQGMTLHRRLCVSDQHRRRGDVVALVHALMRNEAAGSKGPQQLVEPGRVLAVARVDIYLVAEAIGLVRQTAGEAFAAVGRGIGQDVEIDSGHGRRCFTDNASIKLFTLVRCGGGGAGGGGAPARARRPGGGRGGAGRPAGRAV